MSGDERARLAALHEYRLLDGPADDELEAVVRVAATVAGVPTATLNLIDERRQCQLTTTGFEGGDSDRFERRRQARENARLLAEAEERQQFTDAVLETIDVAVVAADATGHLSLFNGAGREWHGLDADPAVDPDDLAARYRLFRPDGTTPLPAGEVPLLRALHGGAVRDAEMIIRPVGAEPRHVVASGRALTAPDGTRLGAVVAMTDVTADRAQRRALERAHADLAATIAELKRSNAGLEQFAGVVSHDLAAPLAVVNGYLELIADEYGNVLDEQAGKWISAAIRVVARMRDLIRSLPEDAAVPDGGA